MKRLIKLTLMVAIAIGTGVGIAMAYTTHQINGTNVVIRGTFANEGIFDVDGDTNISNEIILYMSPNFSGLTSDNASVARAEILIQRDSSTDDDADAWIRGSGGGEVRADRNGDVIITLGS